MGYISSRFNSQCSLSVMGSPHTRSPPNTQPSNNNRARKQRKSRVDHQDVCCPTGWIYGAYNLLRNWWAIWLHKDILELSPHPQSDTIRPAEPCLNHVLTSPARAVAIQRRELLEEVTSLANGLRQVERGVW